MWKKLFAGIRASRSAGARNSNVSTLQDLLGPSGKVQYKTLKTIAGDQTKSEFKEFFPVPALLGKTILSGDIEDARGMRKKTLIFSRTRELLKDSQEYSAIREAVFPLLKQRSSAAGEELLYTIGSQGGVDIVMPDFAISQRHAAICIRARGYTLKDLGSTNGSSINGSNIGKAEKTLKDGDIVAFGRYEFVFHTPESLYKDLRKKR